MRTDYKILREIIDGFSDPDAAPTSDGLAARRPRRPLRGEALDLLRLRQVAHAVSAPVPHPDIARPALSPPQAPHGGPV